MEIIEEGFVEQLPRRFREATFDSFEVSPRSRVQYETVRRWASDIRAHPRGLYLCGGTGMGKTHLACAAGRVLSATMLPVRFVDTTLYLETLRNNVRESRSSSVSTLLRNYPVVVLDEIGAMKPTDFVVEQMYLLVDEAWRTETRVIATGNVTFKEIRELLGDRTASRLVDLTTLVDFEGGVDHRLEGRS